MVIRIIKNLEKILHKNNYNNNNLYQDINRYINDIKNIKLNFDNITNSYNTVKDSNLEYATNYDDLYSFIVSNKKYILEDYSNINDKFIFSFLEKYNNLYNTQNYYKIKLNTKIFIDIFYMLVTDNIFQNDLDNKNNVNKLLDYFYITKSLITKLLDKEYVQIDRNIYDNILDLIIYSFCNKNNLKNVHF